MVLGGAGLFVFANDEDGEVYLRSRVVWEFDTADDDGGCDVVTRMDGKSCAKEDDLSDVCVMSIATRAT